MVQYASYTDAGGRAENEDAVLVRRTDAGSLCAIVADGLGGHGGGALASRAVIDRFDAGWSGALSEEEIAKLVREAHEAVVALQTPATPMKSTLAALFAGDGRVLWTYVGDTRLYHFHNDVLVYQTLDHSVSQVAVTLGDIAADEIRFHADRNRILRALGQEGELPVEVRASALAPGRHAFLLCSDGFWEYVLEREMQQALLQAASPREWLERMLGTLRRRVRSDNDNNTAAAVWIDQPNTEARSESK